MKGVRVFYHLQPVEDGRWLAVYSSIAELSDPVLRSILPSPAVLLLDRQSLFKFYTKFVVNLEKGLLKRECPIKHYFLNHPSLSLFCVEGVEAVSGEGELFRIMAITGIPLLERSENLNLPWKRLLSAALKMFGDEELSEEVQLVAD